MSLCIRLHEDVHGQSGRGEQEIQEYRIKSIDQGNASQAESLGLPHAKRQPFPTQIP